MAAYHYQQGDRPLDGYTIQYALGRGGFGEVYFAVSDSGREVALKAVQNFEEVELRGIGHCMNLKSPHLVMIFDIKHAVDGTPWVIMEYVSGPSLRDVLDESPNGLGVDQAKFFLCELAKGLSYLHEAGVVHRDLKPHNVFFEDGIVKIGDYSLSKVITASHRSGNTMTVGSVHYMAPEISLGRYDKTVDIYALGVILYEMLTGQPPYVGESMGEVLMKHLSSEPDVSQLTEPFAGAVVKAMQRDPADRFQTAQEMVEAVAGPEPAKSLDDSFNPATLSLVGERARQAKVSASAQAVGNGGRQSGNRSRHSEPGTHIPGTPDQAVSTTGSTVPVAVHETGITSAGEAGTAAKLPLLHRMGLNYSPPLRQQDIPDVTSLPSRLFLAAMTTTILISLGLAISGTAPWANRDWLTISMVTFLVFATLAMASANYLSRLSGPAWGIVSRIAWTLPVGCALIVVATATRIDVEVCGPVFWSVMACTEWFDWRCLTAAHRRRRISVPLVVTMGAVAVLTSALFLVHEKQWTALAGALAMAGAITVQLVAPMRRSSVDAPLIEPSPKSKRPRLLYDRTAIVLEIIIGAAVAIIAGLCVNGDDDGEMIALGVATGCVGVVALRFRLLRRAWREEVVTNHFWTRPTSVAVAGPDSGDSRDVTPRQFVVFDRVSIFLELLILAAMALVGGLLLNGDDDLFPLGAAAVVVGLLALRFRFSRHRRIRRQRSSLNLPLSFDRVSIFLEFLIGAAIVAIAAVMYEHQHDHNLVVFAWVAAVVAVVALRLRLARRLDTEQVVARSTVRHREDDMPRQHDEVQEIR